MKAGRKPKPTAVKIANGNPGKHPLNQREPVPPGGKVEPPAWVDGATLKVWGVVVGIMEAMGVITKADAEAVGRYCDGIVLWQRARNFLHERGSTYPIRSKDPVVTVDPISGEKVTTYPITSVAQYPQVAEYRQLSKLLLSFEAEFGLTAAARTRIEVHDLPQHAADPQEQAKRSFFSTGRGRPPLAG